jgi:AcrR family transcriptional regulator
MNTTLRRERERNELRDRILAAARTLLVRGGREAVTMREVARLVEYSPAALYQHFPDKEALIRELCLNDFADFAEVFIELPREGGPLAMLCRAGFAYLEFARSHPEHYRVMFMTENVDSPPDSDAQRNDPTQNAYVLVHHLVAEAIAAGVLRPELTDSHLLAQTTWASVHGVAALDVCRREREAWVDFRSFDERAAAAVHLMTLGLARDPKAAEAAFGQVLSEVQAARKGAE